MCHKLFNVYIKEMTEITAKSVENKKNVTKNMICVWHMMDKSCK